MVSCSRQTNFAHSFGRTREKLAVGLHGASRTGPARKEFARGTVCPRAGFCLSADNYDAATGPP